MSFVPLTNFINGLSFRFDLKWDGRFVFIFGLVIVVEAGLLNCINCNPVPRGTTTIVARAL
jgi:hypothetical protein